MVAGVSQRLATQPTETQRSIQAISDLAERAQQALTQTDTSRAELVAALSVSRDFATRCTPG